MGNFVFIGGSEPLPRETGDLVFGGGNDAAGAFVNPTEDLPF